MFTMRFLALRILCVTSFCFVHLSAQESLTSYSSPDEIPSSVESLWKKYDAKAEPLEIEIHHQWSSDEVTCRLVTFKVGTFKGRDARLAAYYCFPNNGKKNPAFVWSHGGGQKADRQRGYYFATQGFATIDINWLGRPLEAELDPENRWATHWGNVDPTQGPRFYSKALRNNWKRSLQPDAFTLDSVASPRNSNWYLLSLAARRALTFLEKQIEVDPDRLGLSGYSMGGTITVMTAVDPRVKAVAPFVGGAGFLHTDFPGIPNSSLQKHFQNLPLYEKTIDPSAYWPLVKCPVMFLTSSNDFHSTFERIYRSLNLLPHHQWRVSSNMHMNHGPQKEQWVLLNLWFQKHLAKKSISIPKTPPSTFQINEGVAHLSVKPENPTDLKDLEIYYSYDPNCVTRFWKKATAQKKQNSWIAKFDLRPNLPLYTFALCRYKMHQTQTLQRGETTDSFTINSALHTHLPEKLDLSKLIELRENGLVDDFSHGLRDWSSRDQFTLQTCKFQDPALDTTQSNQLAITLNLIQGHPLVLELQAESKFLRNGKDLGVFKLQRVVEGSGSSTVILNPLDFNHDEHPEIEWSKMTTFSLTLTDQAKNQRLKLTDPETFKVLRKIELIK